MGLKKLLLLPVSITLFILSGCMNHNLTTYNTIGQNAHSISVSGADGLNWTLKEVLIKEGWAIVVESDAMIAKGLRAKKASLKESDTSSPRYRLRVKSKQYDYCAQRADPAYNYEIAIVDYKSGDKVMTMEGKGCEYLILEKFSGWLLTSQQ